MEFWGSRAARLQDAHAKHNEKDDLVSARYFQFPDHGNRKR